MSIVVVAEKPSVARDIAHVLGARTRAEGYFRSDSHVVTWAMGHLVTLAEPHEMNPAWKKWRLGDLPLLPAAWPLVVTEATRAQFEVVRRLMLAREVRGIVCATDAGREGELIFRYIYEAAKATKPVRRLWISSLTPDAIAAGLRALKDGKEFDRLADAARARSRADWLVGMNLSRAYSVVHDDNLSVGRVQTPTLAMLVARELEIRAFVPEDYLEVVATFGPPGAAAIVDEPAGNGGAANGGANAKELYEGTYLRPDTPEPEARRLPPDGKEAEEIVARAQRGSARIESVDRQSRRMPPPLLYDLTELQRHANRLYGFTAQRTLGIAQSLYERHKLLSYPRTDSRHLSRTVASTLPGIVDAIAEPYRALLAPGTGARPLGPRFVDDGRVSDHHAIIPTGGRPSADLTADERAIYDLVCRRLLQAWHSDHLYAVTTVITAITCDDVRDRYTSQGTSVESMGWKVLDIPSRPARPARATREGDAKSTARPAPEPELPGGLVAGMPRDVVDAKSVAKKTRAPARFTDGTLLTAMETAGRTLDEKEVSQAMRECGLGTPATRAAILETLLRREYVVREGKLLQATDKGIALIAMVHPHVKSPAMTGEWEAKLGRIERGEGKLDAFMLEIERYVREVVGIAASAAPSADKPAYMNGTARHAPSDASNLAPLRDTSNAAGTASLHGSSGAAGTASLRGSSDTAGAASLRGSSNTAGTASLRGSSDTAGTASLRGSSGAAGTASLRSSNTAGTASLRGSSNTAGTASLRGSSNTAGTASLHGSSGAAGTASLRDRLPLLDLPPAPPPARSRNLDELLTSAFGFSSFRPYQKDVCQAAAAGKDVLLVMPTGAGKSLCYQLPGLARGGTTLVVSPLIALMEDQVAQLARRGLAAARIHSGRDRAESRAACRAYLDGALDYLFIAPERLKVPGFPEMLARRKPALVAVDEAHCISQWGHDFRPDYRMLGERLPLLRPAPIIALTATATPSVQDDIASELRLESPERFIHGFRRTNIGVEVIEQSPAERPSVVQRLLADPARRPAIVYAPTRKDAEQLATELSRKRRLRAAAYHAGLHASARDDVQSAFLEGKLDVVVATIAFGMGIDKANVRTVLHTALPASVEGYYQEIGRAGRDGSPSRAVLLHSFVDTKTHEFFLERNYPDPAHLAQIQDALPAGGCTVTDLAARAQVSPDVFEKALEKLWIHGGAIMGPSETVRRGTADWRGAYERQRAHKREQIDKMRRFAETSACRMLKLVAHFGDQNDPGSPCGQCDVCAPSACVALTFRAPAKKEQDAAALILAALRERDGRAVGQLHRDLFGESTIDRRTMDHVLGGLARASQVRIVGDEFVKDGKTIAFQRVYLTPAARNAPPGPAVMTMIAVPERMPAPKRAKTTKRAKRTKPAKPKTTKSTKSTTPNTFAKSGTKVVRRGKRKTPR
ncbi:DNA topoisomerase 3 [Pendulispora albinea]|uniref:ATP-dependent DNA helicase RecQ n=1 Tax=Pendulispora albinea TaxID=2741071 RepID=A0ABZ2LPA7_9BACT